MLKALLSSVILFSSTTWSATPTYKIVCKTQLLGGEVTVNIEGGLQKNFFLKPTSITMETEPNMDAKYENFDFVYPIDNLLSKLQQFKMYKGELFLVATTPDFQTLMIEANLNEVGKSTMSISNGNYEKGETVCKVSTTPLAN